MQTHTPKASFLGLPAARLAGTTAIYTIHGALYFRDNGRAGQRAGWLFERWCCAWAHIVLVQSARTRRCCPGRTCARHAKIRYVGNGVELDRFTAPVAPARRSALPIVVMVSRLVREKGCADFLALARALHGRAEFVHVGPVEHDPRRHHRARRWPPPPTTWSFVGAVADVRPWLAAADVVVPASYREGIPRVAMEAAAIGRPVVAYDVRGVREVLAPAGDLLVPRATPGPCGWRWSACLDDPDRRRAVGEACRAAVLERFSEDDVVRRLRAVYATLPGAA